MDKILPHDPIMNMALKRKMMPDSIRQAINRAEQVISYGEGVVGRRIAILKGMKGLNAPETLELELLQEFME